VTNLKNLKQSPLRGRECNVCKGNSIYYDSVTTDFGEKKELIDCKYCEGGTVW